VRDFIPSILIIVLAINWSNLSIIFENLIIGLMIMVLGLICSVCLHFIASLPVFWLGDNSGITDLMLEVEDSSGHSNFVYEVWSDFWKTIFTIILPTAISTGVATSVILGKSPRIEMLIISIFVAISMVILTNILWRFS